MKEICQCNCSLTGYRTPWCDLLKSLNGTTGEVLHLWYKLDWLRDEIRKRLAYLGNTQNYENAPNINDLIGADETSAPPMRFHLSYTVEDLTREIERRTAYLGRFRRTEEAAHLLDLIKMTEDERDLFESFVQEAIADVWRVLSAPFVGLNKKAWWQETATVDYAVGAHFDFDVSYNMTNENLAPLRAIVLEALVERVIYKWLSLAYPQEAAAYDGLFQQSLTTIRDRSNEFRALWSKLYIPYAKAAMSDVYDALVMHAPRHEMAYFFNEGKTTVKLSEELEGYLRLSEIATGDVDPDGYITVDDIPVDSFGDIMIAETGTTSDDYITEDVSAGAGSSASASTSSVSTSTSYIYLADTATSDVNADGYIVVDYLPVDASGYILIGDTGTTDDGYIKANAGDGITNDSGSVTTGAVVTFQKDDYVEYNGQLYKATADGDSTDFVGKLVPTEDYRSSIHYGIVWKCCGSNINMVEPLDTAIFEALVARIIYKWLQSAYPAEASRYLEDWNEYLSKISTRVRFLDGPQIVNRISRSF